MINNINIFKKNLMISDRYIVIIIFILFFPHVYHIVLPKNIPNIEFVVNLFNVPSLLMLIMLMICKRKKPSKLFVVLSIFLIWVFISTIINNPERLFKTALYISSSLSIALLIEIFIDRFECLLRALLLGFEFQLYPNLISVILYYKVDESLIGYNNNNYFLGTRNDLILYMLPAFFICVIYAVLYRKFKRPILLSLIIFVTLFLINSTTTLISFLVTVLTLIYCVCIKKNNVKYDYILLFMPILLGVIIVFPYAVSSENIIVDFIMNNVYYKGSFVSRTFIWKDAFNYARKRLLIGYGYFNKSLVFYDDVGRKYAGNAHSDYVQRIINYGLIGLIPYLLFNYILFKSINKAKRSAIISICISFLVGIFITYISQDYHRFFEFQIIFFITYHLSTANSKQSR